MSTAQKWCVTTTTTEPLRKWAVELKWLGAFFIFSLQVNIFAPAVRIVLLGWSLYFGRLIVVKTTTFCPDEIAANKGWVREGTAS